MATPWTVVFLKVSSGTALRVSTSSSTRCENVGSPRSVPGVQSAPSVNLPDLEGSHVLGKSHGLTGWHSGEVRVPLKDTAVINSVRWIISSTSYKAPVSLVGSVQVQSNVLEVLEDRGVDHVPVTRDLNHHH